ncbi:DUF4347 domain-containing protein, partial [Tenacibaculum sp. UWU-22]|uniref:DUF6923 family protein n=1 Tax=Tenacibaculum sp. UWU-22 TaxID=3234187 RepID=UPI0034DAFB21
MNQRAINLKSRVKKYILIFFVSVFTFLTQTAFSKSIVLNTVDAKTNFFVDNSLQQKNYLFQQITLLKSSTVFQLFSHGKPGELLLDGKWKNAEQIAVFLKHKLIKSTITQINIYGCEFGKGAKGQQAVSYLEKTLGVSVAASTNITGVNGDWLLEIGKVQTDAFKKYAYDLQSCAGVVGGTGPGDDFDGDGYCNKDDDDDDNDGILDCVEAQSQLINEELTGPSIFKSVSANKPSNIRPYNSQGIIDGNGTSYANGSYAEWGSGTGTDFGGTPLLLDFTLAVTLDEVTKFVLYNDAGQDSNQVVDFEVIITSDAGVITEPHTAEPAGDNGPHRQEFSLTQTYYNVTDIDVRVITKETSSPAQITEVSLIGSVCIPQDTDGDGVPNYLDLDSDNDGCPDAIEGGGGLVFADLNPNRTVKGTVDAKGVPLAVSGGQDEGTSANQNIQSTECDSCNSVSTLFADNDKDGIGDDCDLDDDNDGITDVEEGFEDYSKVGGCTPQAYLSSGNPSTIYSVYNDGSSSAQYTFPEGHRFNAIGYNYHDGYLWGIDIGVSSFGTDNINELVIIDPTKGVEVARINNSSLTGKTGASFGGNSGDIDIDNKLFYTYHPSAGLNVYDADPDSSTYMQWIENKGGNKGKNIPDITYVYGTGKFYGVENKSNILWEYDSASNSWNNLEAITNLPSGSYGAAYSDMNGIIYLGNNSTGIIYKVDLNASTYTAEYFTQGPAASSNDGAKCVFYTMAGDSTQPDYDKDGIPDYLDLDSDNDGCPDAIEGGADIQYSQLNSDMAISGGVDTTSGSTTYGVPTAAGSGQTVGVSQNAAEMVCCDAAVSGYPDNDGDGIADNCDLDDDNDGILDVVECPENFVLIQPDDWNTVPVADYQAGGEHSFQTTNTGAPYTVTVTTAPSPNAVDNTSMNINTASASPTYSTLGNGAINTTRNSPNEAGILTKFVLDRPSKIKIVGPQNCLNNGETVRVYSGESVLNGTISGNMYNPASVSGSGTNEVIFQAQPAVGPAVCGPSWEAISTGYVTSFEIENYLYPGNSQGGNEPFQVFVLEQCDTDGDGIPNYQDIDSDGDGCPDAIEGSANITYSQLSSDGSISGGVDTTSGSQSYGVPTAAETGQAVGESQNASVMVCCDASASGYPDNDGDGIADDCDLDDDNDGILDADEMLCSAFRTFNLTDISGSGDYILNSTPMDTPYGAAEASANITSNHTATYSKFPRGYADGDLNFANSINTEVSEYKIDFEFPTNIKLSQADASGAFESLETWTISVEGDNSMLTVSDPGVTNVVADNSGTSYYTGKQLQNITGNNTSQVSFSPATTNSSGFISPDDSQWSVISNNVTSLTIRLVTANPGANIAKIRLSVDCVKLDSDDDGIPNHLDLDSDNDGCPDAIEGGGNIQYDQLNTDTSVSGDVDTILESESYGVPTATETGQAVGESQNASVVVCCDVSASGYPDNDGDGIADDCDLDDDNDGILDSVEIGADPDNPIDTDGDGTPDYLDLDSDNDGCPDAIEGAANITYSQLSSNGSISGGVDTTSGNQSYGVPTAAETGQAVGESQNASVVVCCDASASGYPDNDGDGIADNCDLDDDNDGILDTAECQSSEEELLATNVFDTDLGAVSPQTGASFSTSVDDNATYEFAYNSRVTTTASDKKVRFNINKNVDKEAAGNPNNGYFKLTDTDVDVTTDPNKVVVGNFMEILDFDNAQLTVDIGVFDLDGNKVSGIGAVKFTLLNFTNITGPTLTENGDYRFVINELGRLYNGRMRFELADGSLISGGSFTFIDNPGNRDAFLVNFGRTFCSDYDSDGIPNYLDLDSDDDGCPDAIEGDGSYALTDLQSDDSLGTTVDSDSSSATYGVSIVSPATSAVVQGIGSSEDENTFSPACFDSKLGSSKSVGEPTLNPDGTIDVAYTITVKNMGDSMLSSLVLEDDLTAADQLGGAFTPSSATDSSGGVLVAPVVALTNTSGDSVAPTANTAYDGGSANSGLFDATASALAPGDELTVTFTVRVDPNASGAADPLQNTATVKGTDPSGTTVSDKTDSGDEPTTNPGEDVGTPTPLTPPATNPELGSSKELVSMTSNADGTVDAVYSVLIENTGNVNINNLTLSDNLSLASQLGGAFTPSSAADSSGGVLVAPEVTLTNTSKNSVAPTANTAYDGGSANSGLLLGTDGLLAPGDQVTVTFTVRVDPNASGAANPLQNTATVKGTDPSGASVEDKSDSGTSPTSNSGEGVGMPTPLTPPTTNPELGSSKSAGEPTLNPDGTFDVVYTITVQNTGDVNITALTLSDNLTLINQLGSAFTPSSASDSTGGVLVAPVVALEKKDETSNSVAPTANAGYDGGIANSGLLLGTDGLLAPGDKFTVTFTVRVDPHASGAPSPLQNTAVASGKDPSGSTTEDRTDNGDNPTANAGEGVGTPTPLTPPAMTPKLGSAKSAGEPTLNTDGTLDVVYTIIVKNMGDVDIEKLTLLDDLTSPDQLGGAFTPSSAADSSGGVLVAPEVTLTNTSGKSVAPTANTNYSGGNDGLLLGTDGLLAPGDYFTVTFTVRVDPHAVDAPSTLQNTATAGGTDPSGSPVVDKTDTGGNPATNPGEETGTPTPIVVPAMSPKLGSAKSVSEPVANSDGTFDVVYTIVVENMGDVDIDKLTLVDDLTAADQLGGAFTASSESDSSGGVLVAPEVTLTNTSGNSVAPTANSAYDGGSSNSGLLVGTDGLLAPGDKITVSFTVRIDPHA